MTTRITELDFDGIRQNLIDYLKSQAEFQDYDFDGSALSVLIDLLAYNTHYMGYYLNMAGSEMFLDSAQLRESILSHAKMIGYLPHSMKGGEAIVNIQVTPVSPEANNLNSLTLPVYTKFVSEPLNGKPYTFVNLTANTTSKVGSSFVFSNVHIRQGDVVNQTYTVSDGVATYTIPSANVDINTISLTVQDSPSNTNTIIYSQAEDITEVTANTPVFWLEESDTYYTLRFGDGVLGKQLANGNIIRLSYLDTAGQISNKLSNFTVIDSIGPYTSNIIVSTVSTSAGGANKETIEEVRNRAPYAYTTQNRAVTIDDYETLLLDDYPNIDAITVWGGEDNEPPIYGKVFISMKPKEDYYISLDEKERIKNEIIKSHSVLTVTPEIVDPDYTYLNLIIRATYNTKTIPYSEAELTTLIRAAVLDYRDTDLQKFDSTYRESVLAEKIADIHDAITAVDIKTILQKRKEAILYNDRIYSADFHAQLYRGVVEDKFYSFPTITVRDNNGIEQDVYIEDTPNSLSGIDSISVTSSGSGYVYEPIVTILGDGSGAKAKAKINNGRIVSFEILERGTDYTQATVSITSDTGSGATAVVNLEAKNGTLRTFYYKEDGTKVIVNANIGTIDYQNGIVNIRTLEPLNVTQSNRFPRNIFSVNATAQDGIIQPFHNLILDIDENDPAAIVVNLIAEA